MNMLMEINGDEKHDKEVTAAGATRWHVNVIPKTCFEIVAYRKRDAVYGCDHFSRGLYR